MLPRILPSVFLAFAIAVAGIAGASAQSAQGVEHSGAGFHKRVCTEAPAPDAARCHAVIATDQTGRPLVSKMRPNNSTTLGAVPYYARDLWSAYYGTTTRPAPPAGTPPTVAVVAAYGYSRAATDLAQYRNMNGLPPLCSSTVTTGCVNFKRLNQSGIAGSYPLANSGWAQEQALDIQMVSALCPWCNIVLVEANSASYGNLAAAEVTASHVTGVIAINNSYGGGEAGSSLYAASFSPTNTVTNGYAGKIAPNIAITVSSGDGGYSGGTEFPSSAPYVISVGGTSLRLSGSWTQTAWSKAGSGCSAVYSQMNWQTAVLPSTACVGRVAADVSAVADPNTGVAVVYRGSIYQFGGTSVSAPLMAGIIGQHNQPITLSVSGGGTATANYPTPSGSTITASYGKNLYAQRGSLSDVTAGSTGTCSIGFLCNAAAGYDGPTGLGTPNGNLAPF